MPTELQRENYWDAWNRTWRFVSENDAFMAAQQAMAIDVARHEHYSGARILDLGCGTGWLGNALRPFGEVWGVDLAASAIEEGKRRYRDLHLAFDDFMSAPLPGSFDLVVSADSFSQMADHAACARRIAELMKPDGILLLMTMNRWVWKHRSRLVPLKGVPNANVLDWPSLAQMRDWLRPYFTIVRITSLDPGGDRGVLWWVENRWVRGGMGKVLGKARWRSVLESLRLGRELVIVARKKH